MSSLWSYFWAPSAPLTKENIEKLNAELSIEDFQVIGPAEEDFTLVEDNQSVSSQDNTVAFVPTLESPEEESTETFPQEQEVVSPQIAFNALVQRGDEQRRLVEEFLASVEIPEIKTKRNLRSVNIEKKRLEKMTKQPIAPSKVRKMNSHPRNFGRSLASQSRNRNNRMIRA